MGKTLYLCEKPNQGRIIAEALGGGRKIDGGLEGDDWFVTWGFGHLMTPLMPQDYDPELKKWSWDPLPIVPPKFRFKPKDKMATGQMNKIKAMMKKSTDLIISTDADREGELIAYEIMNENKWNGTTKRLWLSDLNLPAVKEALGKLKDAESTKPLYWAAMARTYADWIVGMNMSRAATLKLGAYGAPPMSVGRVQTPVLGMIVNLERKITNFKPEDYFEITAKVDTDKGSLKMRYSPSVENRLKDKASAEKLRTSIEGSKGPLVAKTEAKKESPPGLLDLSSVQQNCNRKFGWSADKSLKVMQALYETHQVLTYPRTDSKALPEEHKGNIGPISSNLIAMNEFKVFSSELSNPIIRSTIYNDKKVTAHHAIVPTMKAAKMSDLSMDEQKLYFLVCQHWIAAHLPDMEYLQTSISLDSGGITLKASGRQITKEGWKVVFSKSTKDENEDEDEEDENDSSDSEQTLPPVKSGDIGLVSKATLDSKKTKPPSRFTEATLLKAMENVAAYVDDIAAKKTLKETSGIGTPATRSNVIETLKVRNYIVIKKKQISPTETAFTLIDAMNAVAPSYANPVMTARWEDVLEEIAGGKNLVKAFVDGIAGSVKKDITAIKDSDIKRMEAPGGSKSKYSGPKPGSPGYIEGDWKKAVSEGTPITVNFDDKDKAKDLGAKWDGDRKSWVIPKGVDEKPFITAGFLVKK
jgi:DNA topoisomerase-3